MKKWQTHDSPPPCSTAKAAFEVPLDPSERWSIEPAHIRAGRNGHRVIGFEGTLV